MVKVNYYKRKVTDEGKSYNELKGECKLLAFGLKNGNSSAIIELDDGTIKNIDVELTQFIDSYDERKKQFIRKNNLKTAQDMEASAMKGEVHLPRNGRGPEINTPDSQVKFYGSDEMKRDQKDDIIECNEKIIKTQSLRIEELLKQIDIRGQEIEALKKANVKFIDEEKTVDVVNIPGNHDKIYYNSDDCCVHQCQNCITGNLIPKNSDRFFCTDCGHLNDNLWKHVDEEEKTVNVVNSPDFNVKVYRANECIYLCENCLSPNSVIRTADYFKCDCGHLNNKLLECDYQCRYCSTYNEVLKTDKMFKCSNCENVNDSLWTYIKYRD